MRPVSSADLQTLIFNQLSIYPTIQSRAQVWYIPGLRKLWLAKPFFLVHDEFLSTIYIRLSVDFKIIYSYTLIIFYKLFEHKVLSTGFWAFALNFNEFHSNF